MASSPENDPLLKSFIDDLTRNPLHTIRFSNQNGWVDLCLQEDKEAFIQIQGAGGADSIRLEPFALFIARKLVAIDPSDDKRYVPALFRWWSYLRVGDMETLQECLAFYHRQPTALPARPTTQPRNPARGRGRLAPVNAEALSEYKRAGHFTAAVTRIKARQDFALLFAGQQSRDTALETEDSAHCLYRDEGMRLYEVKTGRAYRALAQGTCWFGDYDRDGSTYDSLFIIERADGSRHEINLAYYQGRDEIKGSAPLGTLLGDQKIATALLPFMRQRAERANTNLRLGEIFTLGRLGVQIPAYGMLTSEETLAHAFANWVEKTTPEKGGVGGFWHADEHLACVVAYGKTRAHVSGETMRLLLQKTLTGGCWNAAEKILALAATVPHWRTAITAQDVKPLFDGIARAPNRFYAKDETMAYMMWIGARNPSWLTGDEAVHLPKALAHFLQEERRLPWRNARQRAGTDWPKIKTLLARACLLEPWRKQMTPEAITGIRDGGHNIVTALGIDKLLDRLSGKMPERPGRLPKDPTAPTAQC